MSSHSLSAELNVLRFNSLIEESTFPITDI